MFYKIKKYKLVRINKKKTKLGDMPQTLNS